MTIPRTCNAPHLRIHMGAVVLSGLSASPAFAQSLGQGSDDGISIWRVVAVLVLCCVLAVAGAWALRSGMRRGLLPFSAVGRDRSLSLRETLRIGHQINLSIVSYGDEELLIATSPQGAQLLKTSPAKSNVPSTSETSS